MIVMTGRPVRGAPSLQRISADEVRTLTISCPKCASSEARSLEFLRRRGAAAHIPPPRKRDESGWVLLSTASALLMLATLAAPLISFAFGGISALAAWTAFNAHSYNRRRLPQLRARWKHSVMCSSCGEIFLP